MDSSLKKIVLLIVIVGILAVSSVVVAFILSFASDQTWTSGNVAVIPITGEITESGSTWTTDTEATQVTDWLKKADEDPMISAIVLDINSPGGTPVASDEIGQAIKDMHKPVVAQIHEEGASGAYWIASNADWIIANRMSITGSVGVTASYINFAGTLARYNATYEQVTGGDLKELGSPWANLTPEERTILQGKIDIIDQDFLQEVQTNRNLSNATMQTIKSGEFFLGSEAKTLGLVDELGGQNELDAYLNATINETPVYVQYEKPMTLLQELGQVRASILPSTQSGVTVTT